MARFSGKGGSITNAGVNIALTSWDIDAKGDAIDVTGMDDAGIKEFLAGVTEWSGSFEGFATGTVDASKPGTAITAGVFASSSSSGAPKLTGSGFVTGLKVSSAVDGAVKASVTFQGSGALTYGTV